MIASSIRERTRGGCVAGCRRKACLASVGGGDRARIAGSESSSCHGTGQIMSNWDHQERGAIGGAQIMSRVELSILATGSCRMDYIKADFWRAIGYLDWTNYFNICLDRRTAGQFRPLRRLRQRHHLDRWGSRGSRRCWSSWTNYVSKCRSTPPF